MVARTSIYDCETCGVCCAEPWRDLRFAESGEPAREVADSPFANVQPHSAATAVMVAAPELVRTAEGHRVCGALAGCIGVRCSCSVYDRRPEACRRFRVGSTLCRQARQWFGLPV